MAQKPFNLCHLQALRRERNLTQSQLADKAGVKLAVIQKHERGAVHDALLSIAVPLAVALDVPVESLF